MDKAYGGVIINDKEMVLLREPTNHFDGYVWTFAKGEKEPGESDEQAALREVFEETGVRAKIITKIPKTFSSSGKTNEYFLMAPVEETGKFHWETASVKWVTQDEAKELIAMTTKAEGRKRDLLVLEAAFSEFQVQQRKQRQTSTSEQP